MFYYRLPPTHGTHSIRPIDHTRAQKEREEGIKQEKNTYPIRQPLTQSSNQSERARKYTAVRLNVLLLHLV